MIPLRYVPYQELAGEPSVIVDGASADGTVLTLSHWPNTPTPPGLEDDLSAQMAFRYLDETAHGNSLHGRATAVSNNHFDQDGLVSVFALVSPQEALARREQLIEIARCGDFALYENRDAARASMVISALGSPERSPLVRSASADGTAGAYGGYAGYPEWSSMLYDELLGRLPEICDNVDSPRYESLWKEEDASLEESEEMISSGAVRIEEHQEVDLAVFTVPPGSPDRGGHLFVGSWRPGLHPMALHNATGRFTIAVITGQSYELYYRYESWVQYRSARPRPRVDLSPLAERLDALETGGGRWVAEKVSGLTPMLHLEGGGSSISPDRFIESAKDHLLSAPPVWDPYAAATSDT